MQIKDVMTRDVETCSPDDSVQIVARKMKSLNVGCIPIVEGNQAQGIVTDRDITIRSVAEGEDPKSFPVGRIKTADVVTVNQDMPVQEAASLMEERQIRRLLVNDESGGLVGIVSLGDLSEYLSREMAGEVLRDVSEPSAPLR